MSSALAVYDWLKDWQTFVTGILAVGAAWFTIRAMKRQAMEERERHEETTFRKTWAARATMPDALNALCRFTESCMQLHDGRIDQTPPRPSDAIGVLKSAIEFIDTQPAEKVFELVCFYQVHNARLSHHRRRRGSPELADRMYDTALFRYYVNRLYDYAQK